MSHCDKMVDAGRRRFWAAQASLPQERLSQRWCRTRPRPHQERAGRLSIQPPRQYLRSQTERAPRGRLSGLMRRVLLKLASVSGRRRADGTSSAFRRPVALRAFRSTTTPRTGQMNCPGHYSRFDCESGGQQIWGQATQNLPQYALRVDDKGDIYAEGVDELLYGRLSNVL